MARNQNLVVIEGNLCRDPEVTYTTGGTAVCECSLASNDQRKQGDEYVDITTFVTIKFWGRTAEIVGEYLSKGSRITVHGKLRLDTWEKDGTKHYKHYVVCEQLFLPPKVKGGGGDDSEYDQSQESQPRSRGRQQGGGSRTGGGSRGQQRRPPANDPAESGGAGGDAGEDIPF